MGRMKDTPGKRMKEKKNTSKAESCSPNIFVPEEIVVEILSRLPLDSLPWFACVSKQWHCLISNISATKTGSPTVLLVFKNLTAYSFSSHSINKDQQEVVQVKSVYVPWTRIEYDKGIQNCLGSCNGLLLMCIGVYLFLWNPLTRFFKKMLAYKPLWQFYRVRCGLCYDSTGDEYKAVLSLSDHRHADINYGEEVVVFSLRNKSRSAIHFPYIISTVESGPMVDGKLHWFASKNGSGNQLHSPDQIIYFDAQVDKFEEVPMPEPKRGDGDIIVALGVLDGCLCMSRLGNSDTIFEVLVMKDYGVEKSWTILFDVSDCLNFDNYDKLVPLGCTQNGEVLAQVFRFRKGWHIRAFNPNDKSKGFLLSISIPKDSYFLPITYEESLITPTGYDWEEGELKEEATYVVRAWKIK